MEAVSGHYSEVTAAVASSCVRAPGPRSEQEHFGETAHDGPIVIAIEDTAQLGVDRDLPDAEGGGQVVGLESVLKAVLEFEQRGVLNEKPKRGH